jgi:hypothetical protein
VPSATATITRKQRDGIYELVRNHLGAIGDIWIAFEQDKEFILAERLGLEFGEDFRLLQDIGWEPSDGRERFELTMPLHDLMELLQRLHGEAAHVLVASGTEAQSSKEDAATDKRFRLGYEACEKVLAGLDPRAGERA